METVILTILGVAVITVIVIVAKRQGAAPFSLSPSPTDSGRTTATSSIRTKLDEWVGAGLIDAQQAAAIEQHEVDHATTPPSRIPLAAEAIGYIGGGLVFASVALLIGNRWEGLSTLGRIIALAVPTVIAAAAGWWTGGRDEPAMQRLGSVLWLLAVAGAAGVAAELWVDVLHDGDPPGTGTALFIGAATLPAAGAAWWHRRLELQQLAMLAAATTTALGVVDALATSRDSSLSPLAAGLTLVGLGGVWLAAGLLGRLPPRLLAELSGSALVLFGAQIVRESNDHAGLWLGLGAAIALMAIGVARSDIAVLLAGTLGLFVWTPQIALFYLEDTLGAEATLLVIGTLLLVLAGLFTRLYPWVKARRIGSSHRSENDGGPGSQ